VAKYRFRKTETIEDILEAIGRTDIPSTKVVLRKTVVDEETGEYLADMEIEIPDEYALSTTDEEKLEAWMAGHRLKLKEKLEKR